MSYLIPGNFMNIIHSYKLGIILLIVVTAIFAGCTSGRETTKKEETVEEKRTPGPSKIKNLEMTEREYIRKSNIKSVDRLSFNFDEKGMPTDRRKLATVNYNKAGSAVETINYDEEGRVESIYTYVYSDNGIRTETIRNSAAGRPEKKFTYKYNEHGNKIRSERYDMAGNLEKYYEYVYDNEGNLVEDIWYDKNGDEEYRIEYEYENGMKTKARTYNEEGDLQTVFRFMYDSEGNLIEEIKTDPSGNKIGTIQYVYQYYSE
jgi:hypothetical protein